VTIHWSPPPRPRKPDVFDLRERVRREDLRNREGEDLGDRTLWWALRLPAIWTRWAGGPVLKRRSPCGNSPHGGHIPMTGDRQRCSSCGNYLVDTT